MRGREWPNAGCHRGRIAAISGFGRGIRQDGSSGLLDRRDRRMTPLSVPTAHVIHRPVNSEKVAGLANVISEAMMRQRGYKFLRLESSCCMKNFFVPVGQTRHTHGYQNLAYVGREAHQNCFMVK